MRLRQTAPRIAAVASALVLGGAYVSCHQNGGRLQDGSRLLPGSKMRQLSAAALMYASTTQPTTPAPDAATRPTALLYSSKSKAPIFAGESAPRALLPGSKSAVVVPPDSTPTGLVLPGSKSAPVFSREDATRLFSPATQPASPPVAPPAEPPPADPVILTAEPAGPPAPAR